jgi:hypothetical protein
VVVQITSFLTSMKGLESPLFDGDMGTLLQSQPVGLSGSLCTVGGGPLSTCRVADCHSVEELGFQLLDLLALTE